MGKTSIIILSTILGIALPSASPAQTQAQALALAQAAPATAQGEVRAVMERYIIASKTADEAIARSIFHPKAIMTGQQAGGPWSFSTPDSFFSHLAKVAAGPSKPYGPARVVQVSVVGEIATGTVEESNFDGKRYTEVFQLVHENGRWLIISKLWYGTPAS